MSKHTLSKITFSAVVLATALLFTGCPGEAEKPVDNTPVENSEAKDPTKENPTTEEPVTEDPSTENPVTEDPVTEDPVSEDPVTEDPKIEEPVPEINLIPVPKISFNITNAEALGATIPSTQNRSARAAEDEDESDSEALLQKILEDGTVEAAMGIEGGDVDTNWSTIKYVILPPEDINSSDIYLLMRDNSTTRVTVVNKPSKDETTIEEGTETEPTNDETVVDDSTEGETTDDEVTDDESTENQTTNDETVTTDSTEAETTETEITQSEITYKDWKLSTLICIHEDNTYDDVLMESPYEENIDTFIEFKEHVQFLHDGSVVYVCRDGGGYEYRLKKWNPATKETTQLCHIKASSEEGSTQVAKFSISKEEDYIYVYIYNVESDGRAFYYLKILKLSDPTFDKEIGNEFPGVTGWCYSPYDDSLYYAYISYTEGKQGLFKADKKGDNPEFLGYDMYSYLIPQSTQKVWGQAGYDDNIYKLRNILSEKTEEGVPTEEISYTAPEHYYFWGDYIFANDTLYLWHRFGCDDTNGHKDAIIAVPLNDSNCEPKNLLDFNKDLQLHSWDVNENSLFISGFNYETKEPVNSKIDLKSDKQTTIQSDSAFGSIAAL